MLYIHFLTEHPALRYALNIILFLWAAISIFSFLFEHQVIPMFQAGAAKKSMIWKAKYLLFTISIYGCFFPKWRRNLKTNQYYIIALTAFALEDYTCFLKYIKKLKPVPFSQHGWLCIYYLTVCHDIPKAEEHLTAMHGATPIHEGLENMVQAIYLCEKGNTAQGYALMKEIAPDFQLAASKKLAKEYLQKYEPQEEQA